MRLTTRQTGIISYAGLEEDALWAAAKRMFAQSDEPVPDRFRSFLPIFPIELVQNMSYVGRRERNLARVSPAGFSTDPDEYHRLLCAELPDLYTGENALRNFDAEGRYRGGGAVTVKVNGKKELVKIVLSEDAVDPDDVEMLQDLIVAAVNEAMKQAEEAGQELMGKMTGGLGGGFPF